MAWHKVIIYDVESSDKAVLVMYSAEGGLQGEVAKQARSHYQGLRGGRFKFHLKRSMGSLGEDKKGDQGMVMTGLTWHTMSRPAIKKLCARLRVPVSNHEGELFPYADVFKFPELFSGEELEEVWDAVADCMRELIPSATAALALSMVAGGMHSRVNPELPRGVISSDGLVNNVGVSSDYASRLHYDFKDVGWTVALSLKCDRPGRCCK